MGSCTSATVAESEGSRRLCTCWDADCSGFLTIWRGRYGGRGTLVTHGHTCCHVLGHTMRTFTVSKLLVLVALVLFLLAAFHVGLGTVDLIALGLAVYMASILVP